VEIEKTDAMPSEKPAENQLQTLVSQSGLEQSKAQVLLEKFSNYFVIAADWERKARAIIVTDESQTAEMAMARAGRLFLREKRIAVEKTRKDLKEQSLREGKAIDGLANVLKALIVPIENHLADQEHYAERMAEQRAAAARAEAEAEAARKAAAEEAARIAEQDRIRAENERLRREAEEREAALAAERTAAAKAKAEQERAEREAEQRRIEAERKAEAERRAAEEREAALKRQAAEAEARAKAEQERAEREIRQREEAEARAEAARLKDIEDRTVTCPHCGKSFVR